MEGLNHTPGPWVTYDDGITQVIASDKDRTLRMGCVFHDSKNLDVVQANARLIAAAPEMLEALMLAHEELLNIARLQDWHAEAFRGRIEKMTTAIEKATGSRIDEAQRGTTPSADPNGI